MSIKSVSQVMPQDITRNIPETPFNESKEQENTVIEE